MSGDTFELNFARATADDNGNWAVIARNAHGEMSQFFKFSAQMLPRFKQKICDLEANETKQASESISSELYFLNTNEKQFLPTFIRWCSSARSTACRRPRCSGSRTAPRSPRMHA